MSAAREASSGLSSPGPDSDIENQPSGRPLTAGSSKGNTPSRQVSTPNSSSRGIKNKESPSPENDNDQPAKKKRHRRTRAELEADRRLAKEHPELYHGKKNPRLIDPKMKRPVMSPGNEATYRGSPGQSEIHTFRSKEVNAGSPPLRMMPYTASLPPEQPRRDSVPTPATTQSTPQQIHSPPRNGNHETVSHQNSPAVPAPPPPPSQGLSYSANPSPRAMHYDPIRGYSTAETPRSNPPTATASPQLKMVGAPSAAANRASASPAISSLIDPPDVTPQVQNRSPLVKSDVPLINNATNGNIDDTNQNRAATPRANSSLPNDTIVLSSHTRYSDVGSSLPADQTAKTNHYGSFVPPAHAPVPVSVPGIGPPTVETPKPVAALVPVPAPGGGPSSSAETPKPVAALAPREPLDSSMDVDSALKPHSSRVSVSSGGPSPNNGPTKPKEKREKPPLPPLPGSGSGLLTSAMLGLPGSNGAVGASDVAKPPVISIKVELDKGGNNIFNFNRLAEEKYGFNALHPRLAAQKSRLARVAAAGAMLENEARARAKGLDPDAMSEDLDGGSEDEKNADSNPETGGMSGAERGNEPLPKRRKRNFKEDNYDKADPFVDDSELGLDEQAALATDGFFVYCGPLVEEGRMPTIQGRPDGVGQTGGRGRGRGRGRGGGPGSRGGKVPGVEGSGTGRGGGPGSRGGRGSRGRGRGRGGGGSGANASSTTVRDATSGNANIAPAPSGAGTVASAGAGASTGASAANTAGGTGGGSTDLASYIRSFQANEQSNSVNANASTSFASGTSGNASNAIVVD